MRERDNNDPEHWHRRIRDLDDFEATTTARLSEIMKNGAGVRLGQAPLAPRQVKRLKALSLDEVVPPDVEERAEILREAIRKLV